ncbi:hypothetical protein OG753_28190 [Streptomyces sp. NBC_00029]|uniref:hypothetical protein n=1 Tax=Streptomyces sp. NBC_00029 TaxID=2903613 RepID=UPI003254B45F
MLLACSDISVPSYFSGESLDDLKNAIGVDPRLAESHKNINGSRARITQFLAGAPVQMERYRNAPEVAKAVLDAAIDLRRFGHGPSIPGRLLVEMAAATMDVDLLNRADDDWFDTSLEYLLSPCRGASGPLVRVRRFPGSPVRGDEAFQVADYLEQVGRSARSSFFPPLAILDVVLRGIVEAEDLRALAAFLVERGRVFHASQVYLRALDLGDYESADRLADLLEFAKDRSGAVEIARIRHQGGDPAASANLAYYLYRSGQKEESAELCIEEFDLGNSKPFIKVREAYELDDNAGYGILEGRILSRKFPEIYSRIFRSDAPSDAARRFAEELGRRMEISMIEAVGLVNGEMELLVPRLRRVTEALSLHVEEIQVTHDRLNEYMDQLRSDANGYGEMRALRRKIEACEEAGDLERARGLIAEGLNVGSIGLETLGGHLERFGQQVSAESVERFGVDWDGNPRSPWDLADVRGANRKSLG